MRKFKKHFIVTQNQAFIIKKIIASSSLSFWAYK